MCSNTDKCCSFKCWEFVFVLNLLCFKTFFSAYLGLILARGGSKQIPLKNVVPLGSKPLISWAIGAMQVSLGQVESRTVISSQSVCKFAYTHSLYWFRYKDVYIHYIYLHSQIKLHSRSLESLIQFGFPRITPAYRSVLKLLVLR